MGIDVWRPRRQGSTGSEPEPVRTADAAGSVVTQTAAGTSAQAAKALLAEGVTARQAAAPQEVPDKKPGASMPGPAAGPAHNPADARIHPASSPPAPGVRPFTVWCFSRPGALLLIETADPRAARRFAADLLAALTGIWGGETEQLRFEWPQPGLSPSEDSVTRALAAFVGKQVGDNGDALVLVGAEVADRLAASTLPESCLVLPRFDTLMTDGACKRALWQDVGSRRSR
jgi:hypothetical protein